MQLEEELAEVPLFISRREMVQHELANWFGDWFERLTMGTVMKTRCLSP